MKKALALTSLLCALVTLSTALRAGEADIVITIKEHRFSPAEITIPADTRVKLLVRNLDPSAEEFESYELNREKIVPGGKDAIIYIGPVQAGRYPFFGEFHQDTAQGVVVAK